MQEFSNNVKGFLSAIGVAVTITALFRLLPFSNYLRNLVASYHGTDLISASIVETGIMFSILCVVMKTPLDRSYGVGKRLSLAIVLIIALIVLLPFSVLIDYLLLIYFPLGASYLYTAIYFINAINSYIPTSVVIIFLFAFPLLILAGAILHETYNKVEGMPYNITIMCLKACKDFATVIAFFTLVGFKITLSYSWIIYCVILFILLLWELILMGIELEKKT